MPRKPKPAGVFIFLNNAPPFIKNTGCDIMKSGYSIDASAQN